MAIGAALEAEIGDRQGQSTDIYLQESIAEVPELRRNCGELVCRTSDIAAKKAGFGSTETYERARKVVDQGNATREYESEQDTFSMFIDERCVRTANARVLSIALYRDYKVWAEEHGETPASHKTFASLMSERGFVKSKTVKGALYSGLGSLRYAEIGTKSPVAGTPRSR